MKEQEPKNFKYPKYLAGAELIGSEGFPKIMLMYGKEASNRKQ